MKSPSQIFRIATSMARAKLVSATSGINFNRVGKNFSLFGSRYIKGAHVSVGDNCWFQAINEYKGMQFTPLIRLGHNCMFSNNVHISSVKSISIGNDCLFGSNIYIGDHSHGSTKPGRVDLHVPPAQRPLDDIADIVIGDRVWVGDGAVILAGSHIPDGCIVGANSVVKGVFPPCTLIAGAPAHVIRQLQ